jgi:predicted sulfurtransferase
MERFLVDNRQMKLIIETYPGRWNIVCVCEGGVRWEKVDKLLKEGES